MLEHAETLPLGVMYENCGTVTVVVLGALVHPPAVIVSVYVPDMEVPATRVGSSLDEVHPSGPTQL